MKTEKIFVHIQVFKPDGNFFDEFYQSFLTGVFGEHRPIVYMPELVKKVKEHYSFAEGYMVYIYPEYGYPTIITY